MSRRLEVEIITGREFADRLEARKMERRGDKQPGAVALPPPIHADQELSLDEPAPRPGLKTLGEIIEVLSREIPARFLGTKKKGGREITIYSWIVTQKFLDLRAPGWQGRARPVLSSERVACAYEICIPTSDFGLVCREATGDDQEDDDEGWGSPMTRAEAQAFKRAAARFGFGLYLREKKEK